MPKLSKTFWIIVCIAVVLVAAFIVFTLLARQDATTDPVETPTVTETIPPTETPAEPTADTLIVVNGMFFGAYTAEGVWKQSGFTVNDLLSVPAYYTYTAEPYSIIKNDKVYLPVGLGLEGFNADEIARLTAYADGEPAEGTTLYPYKLPVAMSESDAAIAMPDYNAYLSLAPDHLQSTPLALSVGHNALPRDVQTNTEITESMEAAVRLQLNALGLTNAPGHISQAITVKLLGNGPTHTLLIANTPSDEGYPVVTQQEIDGGSSGSYSMALLLEGNEVTVLFEQHDAYDFDSQDLPEELPGTYFNMKHCYAIDFMGCYDVNGDDTYEIFLQNRGWEWGSGLMYALTHGNWTNALKHHYGM